MKVLTKYLLPATLVAGFLFFFVQAVFFDHYPNPDDYVYDGLVRKLGTIETIKLLFKIDTGRWFSHIICAPSFYFLGHDFFRYGLYLSAMYVLFILSISFFYKTFCQTFFKQTIPFIPRLKFSLVFVATVFFLLFEGRLQSFGWVSSTINHLLSVILCFYLFALLIRETRSLFDLFLVLVLAACVGGSNEVNAICMVLCILGLLLFNKFYFPKIRLRITNMAVAAVTVILSLLINIASGGYEGRMNGLPSFTLLQSVKNTIHSFLLPFLHYVFLPLFLGVLAIFILFLKDRPHHFPRKTLVILSGVAGIVIVSFFLNCYVLSDVVPDRAAIWGYSVALMATALFLRSGQKAGA